MTIVDKINIQKDILKIRLHRLLKTANFARTENEHRQRLLFYKTFLKPNGLCFDVGANLGNRSRVFLELQNKVIAIEPQNSCYYFLQQVFGKQLTIVKKGVSNKKGQTSLQIADTSSTISSISEDWIKSVGQTRFSDSTWTKKETIELTTLDELIKEYGLPDFIKIDVEGHEPEVLQGLSHTIPCISFEYTTPEQQGKLFECLHRLDQIYPGYVYNFSSGENNNFDLSEWLSSSTFMQLIQSNIHILKGFGDVYARKP